MPKISIVVPVYNAEKQLRKCVDSILAQTISDIEVILVDDGATDSSPAICDEYAAKDCRVQVIHQVNSGVSAARNSGLDIAQGKYIAFVDSDDYIDAGMYEAMLKKALEQNCDVVLCDCLKEYSNQRELYTHNIRAGFYNERQLRTEYWPHLLIMENIEYPATISNWVMLIRNINVPRYLHGVRFSEDWLFGAQVMLAATSFYYMKGNAYYHYVMNPQSTTHRHVSDKWQDYLRLYEGMQNAFQNYPDFDFRHQLDLSLLFLVYNSIGNEHSAIGKSQNEKYRSICAILAEPLVREMFGRIQIVSLPISIKQKIVTWCYKYRMGIRALIRYYQQGTSYT